MFVNQHSCDASPRKPTRHTISPRLWRRSSPVVLGGQPRRVVGQPVRTGGASCAAPGMVPAGELPAGGRRGAVAGRELLRSPGSPAVVRDRPLHPRTCVAPDAPDRARRRSAAHLGGHERRRPQAVLPARGGPGPRAPTRRGRVFRRELLRHDRHGSRPGGGLAGGQAAVRAFHSCHARGMVRTVPGPPARPSPTTPGPRWSRGWS